MKRRKNSFFNFCFSFIPGAVEMYLGFFKMGVSIMGLFGFIAYIAAITGIGEIMFINVIVYAYAFFHAHHLAGMTVEELNELEDELIFNKILNDENIKLSSNKVRKYFAIAIIFLGTSICLKTINKIMPHNVIISNIIYYMPRFVIGIAIIVAGIHLIAGKKKELLENEDMLYKEEYWEEDDSDEGQE